MEYFEQINYKYTEEYLNIENNDDWFIVHSGDKEQISEIYDAKITKKVKKISNKTKVKFIHNLEITNKLKSFLFCLFKILIYLDKNYILLLIKLLLFMLLLFVL